MDDETSKIIPDKMVFHKIKWNTNFWFAIIPFVFGLLLFYFPQLVNSPELNIIRKILGLLFFTSPFLIPIFIWFFKNLLVCVNRIKEYPKLHLLTSSIISENNDFHHKIFEIINRLTNKRAFEIIEGNVRENKILLKLAINPDIPISKSDWLIIVDNEDATILGLFQVTSIRGKNIYALSSSIDPIFSGYIHSAIKTSVFPNIYAVYVPAEEL